MAAGNQQLGGVPHPQYPGRMMNGVMDHNNADLAKQQAMRRAMPPNMAGRYVD